jgi:hypothetical protein
LDALGYFVWKLARKIGELIILMNFLLLVLVIPLGLLRVFGHKSEIFQAVAHLYVGFLFGIGLGKKNKVAIAIAVGLSVLELICFIVMKSH